MGTVMATSRQRQKGRKESGRFAGIPVICLDQANYISLSMAAKALLTEFCRQYNGFNNGDLSAPYSLMSKRGFRSKGTLSRAIRELKDNDWILVSRQGGKNQCSLFALTFHAIDDCKGKLDIKSTTIPPGTWKKLNLVPHIESNVPRMCTNSMN
jgi:hypothetical protein